MNISTDSTLWITNSFFVRPYFVKLIFITCNKCCGTRLSYWHIFYRKYVHIILVSMWVKLSNVFEVLKVGLWLEMIVISPCGGYEPLSHHPPPHDHSNTVEVYKSILLDPHIIWESMWVLSEILTYYLKKKHIISKISCTYFLKIVCR